MRHIFTILFILLFFRNNSQNFNQQINIGLAQMTSKDFTSAIGSFQKAINLNPAKKNEKPYQMVGDCFDSLRLFEKAYEAYIKAYEINSRNEYTLLRLGELSEPNFKWREGIDILNTLIAKDPKCQRAYIARGRLKVLGYYREGIDNFSAADKDFAIAFNLDSNNVAAINNKARMVNRQGNLRLSEYLYTRSLQINPGDPYVYYYRAFVRRDLRDTIKAISDINYAMTLKPNFKTFYAERGHLYFEFAMYAKSFDDFSTSISLGLANEGYFGRGRASFYLENYESASADFENVIASKSPDDNYYISRAYYYRGFIYSYDNNSTAACNDWALSMKLGYAPAEEIRNSNCK